MVVGIFLLPFDSHQVFWELGEETGGLQRMTTGLRCSQNDPRFLHDFYTSSDIEASKESWMQKS